MPKHKVHRSPNARKSDIQILTCLLRLRCQPPVPYSLIASLLLQTRPSLMVPMSAKAAPNGVAREGQDGSMKSIGDGLQMWLEGYLEDVYVKAEAWGSEAWRVARAWNGDGVRHIVAGLGLSDDEEEEGFVVMGEEELALQIRWRKEGDWRAGSTPLGRPKRLVEEEGSRDDDVSTPPVRESPRRRWRYSRSRANGA